MYLFLLSVILLIIGYCFYGLLVDKVFGVNEAIKTPAIKNCDSVDFVPLKPYKVFLIQFLNIAGVGPVFGAFFGAL